MAYLVFITMRSLIHLLLPDGGAQSIATIDVHVAGGSDIVAMFGQWGAIQLLLAGCYGSCCCAGAGAGRA
jgi:hypothetical protein